jgi:hypothetical protein
MGSELGWEAVIDAAQGGSGSAQHARALTERQAKDAQHDQNWPILIFI